jgi:hypothetical protein
VFFIAEVCVLSNWWYSKQAVRDLKEIYMKAPDNISLCGVVILGPGSFNTYIGQFEIRSISFLKYLCLLVPFNC